MSARPKRSTVVVTAMCVPLPVDSATRHVFVADPHEREVETTGGQSPPNGQRTQPGLVWRAGLPGTAAAKAALFSTDVRLVPFTQAGRHSMYLFASLSWEGEQWIDAKS
jgi:hypothetical protein